MKITKSKTNILLKKLTEKMIYNEVEGWPPDCVGFVYQPMRPNRPDENPQSTPHQNIALKDKNT